MSSIRVGSRAELGQVNPAGTALDTAFIGDDEWCWDPNSTADEDDETIGTWPFGRWRLRGTFGEAQQASSLNSVLAAQLAGLPCSDSDVAAGRIVTLSGTTSAADGGGGQFVGITSEDTPNNITTFASATSGKIWSRVYSGPLNIRWAGAHPSATPEVNSAAILATCLLAIRTGQSVYIPAGTYLCTYNVLLLTFAESTTRTFSMWGDGPTSVLKMGDGLVGATGRRFLDLRPAVDMDVIELSDFMLDNNARGSSEPDTPYEFEQSHTLRFALADGVTTKLLRYSGLIIKDPVADGMNNQGLGVLDTWHIDKCSEIGRTRVRSSIQQSLMARNLIITGFSGQSIESEPVAAQAFRRNVQISDSVVERLDMAGYEDGDDVHYQVANTTVSGETYIGGCHLTVIGSSLRMSGDARINYCKRVKASNTTFLLQYNPDTGAVSGLDVRRRNEGASEIEFSKCDFVIDHDGALPVAATGFALKSSSALPIAQVHEKVITVQDCTFDPRLGGSVDCYRNGTWILKDNTYACATSAAAVAAIRYLHGAEDYGVLVRIEGGDFRNCVGNGLSVSNAATTVPDQGKLVLSGDMYGAQALAITKNSGGTLGASDPDTENSRVVHVASLPSSALNGDRVRISAADVAVGAPNEYVATATSTSDPGWRVVGQKGLAIGDTASRPAATANDVGLEYIDTDLATDGVRITWNGSNWVDATGTVV